MQSTTTSPATPATLSAVERKFMQKLLACPNQTAAIDQIQPNPKTSATQRDRICRRLHRLGLVHYTVEVTRFSSTPLGKTTLKLDCPRACLPITPDERAILLACQYRTITPQNLESLRLSSPEQQQQIIRNLANRRLIKIVDSAITHVSATQPQISS